MTTNPPISAARIRANQQNAQLSTGPRTPKGKATSSQNGLKHGLTTSDHFLACQYPAEFQSLVNSYAARYIPQDQTMHDLIYRLACARIRQNRATELKKIVLQHAERTPAQDAQIKKFERYRKSAEAVHQDALRQLHTIAAQYRFREVQAAA